MIYLHQTHLYNLDYFLFKYIKSIYFNSKMSNKNTLMDFKIIPKNKKLTSERLHKAVVNPTDDRKT